MAGLFTRRRDPRLLRRNLPGGALRPIPPLPTRRD